MLQRRNSAPKREYDSANSGKYMSDPASSATFAISNSKTGKLSPREMSGSIPSILWVFTY